MAPRRAAPQIVHDVIASGGSPLPPATRAFFEPQFACDFSRVRVHTESGAAKSATAVNALAYTVGRNVVFADGQYSPNSESGRKLIAHELTHVVQQQHSTPPRGAPIMIGDQCGVAEQEASRVAEQVSASVQGDRPTVSPAAAMLQRQQAKSPSSSSVDDSLKQLGYVVIGSLDVVLENNWSALGLPMSKAHEQPFAQMLGIPVDATAYSLGRGAGHLLSLLQTASEFIGGATLIVSGGSSFLAGVATTPEGFGVILIPVGIEAIAAGATIATHGVALGSATIMNMTKGDGVGNSTKVKSNSVGNKSYKINQMNEEIKRNRAPKTIKRVDKGKGANGEGLGEQDQVHFDDGAALNSDGTWKHGEGIHRITNQEREWLTNHGWPSIPQ